MIIENRAINHIKKIMPFDIGEDWRTRPWYNTCLQCIRIILFLHYIRSVYSCYVFSMHLNIPAKMAGIEVESC